jgi:HSP20 family protein
MTTIARADRPTETFEPLLDAGPDRQLVGGLNHVCIEDFLEDDRYVLRADLPGVDPETDVRVTITGDLLTISGRRRAAKHDRTYREVVYGSFGRTLRLPAGCRVDEARARYDAGVLQVTVPIGARSHSPIEIPVQLGRELKRPRNR